MRMIAATASTAGTNTQRQEGRSKLLLASVPPGVGAADEVAKRLTLWEERRLEGLLEPPPAPAGEDLDRPVAGLHYAAPHWAPLTRQRKKNKQLVNQHQVILQSKVLRMRQWGISLPGACERLCHWRGTIEPMAADLDLVNMFGNAE